MTPSTQVRSAAIPFIISLFVDKCQIKDLLCYCSVIMSASSIMKGWEQGQHYWLCLRPYYVWLAYRIWGLDKGPLGWDRLTAGSPGQRLRFEICWQIQRRTTTAGDSLCSCGHKGSLTGTLEQSFETPATCAKFTQSLSIVRTIASIQNLALLARHRAGVLPGMKLLLCSEELHVDPMSLSFNNFVKKSAMFWEIGRMVQWMLWPLKIRWCVFGALLK